MVAEPRAGITAEDYNYPAFVRSTALGMSAEFRGTVRVGDQAPDFTLADLEGGVVRLADLRGQIVVLEFGSIT